MPRSGVRNRANKGVYFPFYHAFAALPTSRDRIKGLFSYLCNCITFWGVRQFFRAVIFAAFGCFADFFVCRRVRLRRPGFKKPRRFPLSGATGPDKI